MEAEEDLALLLAEGERSEVRHAPLADHRAREVGRDLDVVARAGGLLVEDDLLRDPAAHQDRDLVERELLVDVEPVLLRELLREAQRAAAGDDGDLVHGVGAMEELNDERVAGLVDGRGALLLLADDDGAPLRAHQHLVLRELEVVQLEPVLVAPRGVEGRFVDEVLDVGAREARRPARDLGEVDLRIERRLLGVDLEDPEAAVKVGPRHDDPAVEAAGPEERRVEHVGAVGGGDEDDALVRLEPVHLDEELVQRLLALVVAAAEASAAVATDGVDLVDEDDAGRVLLALLEEVAHAARADAHEHLDEVGARDREEGHARLARDGAREERLAGAGGSHEQHALRDAAAEARELLRVLQEGDDLLELVLRLVDPRDVCEGDLVVVLGHELRLRLPEAHRLAAARLQLAHEEEEEEEEEDERQGLHEHRHPERVALGLVVDDLDALCLELGEDGGHRVDGPDRVELAVVLEDADVVHVVLHLDLANVTVLDLHDEVRERELLLLAVVRGEELVERHEHQDQHDPQQDRLVRLAQDSLPLPLRR